MSDDFDPYFKWLAIPPDEQPPNHYRLLGVPLFLDDPDVIEAAADQRMMLLRSYQGGARAALSQKLLNEVSNAKVCLLNAERKAEYDAQLRERGDDTSSIFEETAGNSSSVYSAEVINVHDSELDLPRVPAPLPIGRATRSAVRC